MRRRLVVFAVLAVVAGLMAGPAGAIAPDFARGPTIDGPQGQSLAEHGRSTAPGQLAKAERTGSNSSGPDGASPDRGKPEKPVNENRQLQMNVLLNTSVTDEILAELNGLGRVIGTLDSIDALFMQIRSADVDALLELPYVAAANPDAERYGAPIDTVQVEDFTDGMSTWNLDAINVAEPDIGDCDDDAETPDAQCDATRISETGEGVYVAVLDTGLVDQWRRYFPEERIATEYAMAFSGGGGERGNVSTPPNKWEHDTNSHGTHVTSTILGYDMGTRMIGGVAPMAQVIPVKVLHSGYVGFGWSSMIAEGITYVAELKADELATHPVVINMSLGGPELDAVERAAIDFALAQGVIIVAAAGNEGEEGMSYPGAYQPVISAAAAGWGHEWTTPTWWRNLDVPESDIGEFYITDFSSRALEGQDLDVAAPGSWIVGPFNLQQGTMSFYYLGGTSMASPHVAGVVALMAESNPALSAAEAEEALEDTALPWVFGSDDLCLTVDGEDVCWGPDSTGAGLVDAVAAVAAVSP